LAGALILSLLVRETWRYLLGLVAERAGASLWRRIRASGTVKPTKEKTDGPDKT
jgi:hypothetical protein